MARNNNTKQYLFKQQSKRCCYCEKSFEFKDLTFEHLRRRCEGGTDYKGNLALACEPCNTGRGSMDWFTYKSYILGELCYG